MDYNILPKLTNTTQWTQGVNGFTFIGDFYAYAVLDRNESTGYRSGISPRFPDYLTFNFPTSYYVCGYKIVFPKDINYQNMATWDFQGLINGVWITIHSGSNTLKPASLTYTFASQLVTSVRIKCKSRHGDNSWGFAELEVYDANSVLFLKKGNDYFTIKSEFYNSEAERYNPTTNIDFTNAFLIGDLFKEVTIGEKTFKPIDKFDNFKLVLDINNTIKVKGTKSSKELVVASGDINTTLVNSIKYFKLNISKIKDGDVKIAFSTDKGETWYSHDGTTKILLDCTIPLKDYQLMIDEERSIYNISKDTIFENGMSIEIFNTLNFDDLETNRIRFAYVIQRPLYNDACDIKELSWKFDAEGYLKELKDTEYDLDVYDHRVRLKSKITNKLIQLNVVT